MFLRWHLHQIADLPAQCEFQPHSILFPFSLYLSWQLFLSWMLIVFTTTLVSAYSSHKLITSLTRLFLLPTIFSKLDNNRLISVVCVAAVMLTIQLDGAQHSGPCWELNHHKQEILWQEDSNSVITDYMVGYSDRQFLSEELCFCKKGCIMWYLQNDQKDVMRSAVCICM